MYISKKELAKLEFLLDLLDRVVTGEETGQNNYFIEGVDVIREELNKGYKGIEKVNDREVMSIARKIVRTTN